MRVGGGGGGGRGGQRPARASGGHSLNQRTEQGGLPQEHVCPPLCRLVWWEGDAVEGTHWRLGCFSVETVVRKRECRERENGQRDEGASPMGFPMRS